MKTIVEDVIVKDYKHQGLAIFDPTDVTNLGNISGWTTLLVYGHGERPDMTSAPMCYGECSMGYFLMGTKPAINDDRVEPFMERYRAWAEYAYQHNGEPVKLVLNRVMKDQERYRRTRWAR